MIAAGTKLGASTIVEPLGSGGARSLISADGKEERDSIQFEAYASRSENTVQFGEDGKILYALRLDRRTIDVVDVASSQPKASRKSPALWRCWLGHWASPSLR
jgi:hypothetical protein